jgi:hypothetical protein
MSKYRVAYEPSGVSGVEDKEVDDNNWPCSAAVDEDF